MQRIAGRQGGLGGETWGIDASRLSPQFLDRFPGVRALVDQLPVPAASNANRVVADWRAAVGMDRHEILRPALATKPGSRERGEVLRRIAAEIHLYQGERRQFDFKTLQRWLLAYDDRGLAGLTPKDKGRLTDPGRVIAASIRPGQELPVDYEHQMERKDTTGPIPAAGWIVELATREGGIWGRVSWTPRGAELLANREYRYLSPSMMVRKGGEVQRIIGAGLVHRPALDLKALAHEEPTMSDQDEGDLTLTRAELAECLGLDADKVTAAAVLDRLKAHPDPAAFVPIEAVKELLAERENARNALSEYEAEARVDTAMRGGHVTPAMRPWALELCRSDPESFEGFLSASPAPWKHLFEPMRATTGTRAAPPRRGGFDEDEARKAVCAQLGLKPDDLDG